MAKKTKKAKVVEIAGMKYDVIYREHDARSTTTKNLLNLFVIHTMDSYVLIPHKEFPVKNAITVQVTDHIQCSVLGDVDSKHHKLQLLLNRIDMSNDVLAKAFTIGDVISIAINLNPGTNPDNTTSPSNVRVWFRGADVDHPFSAPLNPEMKDKKKKKDKK